MKDVQVAIEELVAEGEKFTYDNFSEKSKYGYTADLSPAWIRWRTRVGGLIENICAPKSAPIEILSAAAAVELRGNGDDKFRAARGYYLEALQVALTSLENDKYKELKRPGNAKLAAARAVPRKVFIVHGHDDAAREMVARFLEKIEVEPVILHEQANRGATVIEKIETYGNVGFAVVLLTPDDEGAKRGDKPLPRARQNVLLELGYFIGRLGRANVCALMRGQVDIPSDFAGAVWTELDNGAGWKMKLAQELQAADIKIDWNKVMKG